VRQYVIAALESRTWPRVSRFVPAVRVAWDHDLQALRWHPPVDWDGPAEVSLDLWEGFYRETSTAADPTMS